MHRRQFVHSTLLSAFTFLPSLAASQPSGQPVHIIFPFMAGSSGDTLTRVIAENLGIALNRAVIVENKTGASGLIGIRAVKDAAADGATLLIAPIAPMSVYQHVYKSLPYDPIKDFQPIAQIATFDFGIAVGPQVPAKSIKELVAWLQANPTQANYGTPAAGTLPHFFAVLFGSAAGLNLQHIPFRGGAAALSALMGGQIPMVFTSTDSLTELHKAGRIRVLATSDRNRSPFLPEVPTFQEAGYSIEGRGWFGMFGPAGTRAGTVEHLNKLVVSAIQVPDVQKRILALGLRPTGTSAAEFAAIQRADSELWAPAVKASGFTISE
jgi:tripartite-type tricarboxylate transporter receptor subunit TctC